jgi:type IV secretion system protein VirB4
MFRTTGGTPYLFHFHVADIGNIAMFGRPIGQDDALLFLLRKPKLGVTTYSLTRIVGRDAFTRLGGTYLVLPSGQPTGMAPLCALSDTPQDRSSSSAG